MNSQSETTCEWCKRPFPPDTQTEPAETAAPTSETKPDNPELAPAQLIGGCLTLLLIVLVFGLCLYNVLTEKPGEIHAITAAKQVVRRDLLDPSSARFENVAAIQMSEEPNIWLVGGTVRAKNAFGAYIPKQFRVEVELINKEQFKVLDVQIY